MSSLACAGPGLLALLLKPVALKERRGSVGTLLEVTGHLGEDESGNEAPWGELAHVSLFLGRQHRFPGHLSGSVASCHSSATHGLPRVWGAEPTQPPLPVWWELWLEAAVASAVLQFLPTEPPVLSECLTSSWGVATLTV